MNLGFTLEQDETIIRKANRHWIALVPAFAAAIAAVIVAVAITYLFARYRSDFPASMTGAGLIIFDIFMIIFALAIIYAGYWVWKRNFLVLTNKHIVRIEQKGLFAHTVSQLALARVQDVSGSVSGFIATIFGYGNLTVETAGAEDNFVFNTIYTPSDMAAACLKAHEECLAAVAPPTSEPVVKAPQAPSQEMPIPTATTPIPTPTPEPVPEPAPAPVVTPVAPPPIPDPVVVPLPEPEPEPTPAPAPAGPIPLDESVTASIEHHES